VALIFRIEFFMVAAMAQKWKNGKRKKRRNLPLSYMLSFLIRKDPKNGHAVGQKYA
jgi:hypothetical protein